ncbi:arabinofuranosidase catalytic domain-containing protein [Diaminobutyricibacter sp. McL0618]|uniref:arabinofuranosidase catalytic domain-containing protein n=1 Tax=Leifsonia sp. McL0618 TaxID=3415677 RepID=UPI003CFB212B
MLILIIGSLFGSTAIAQAATDEPCDIYGNAGSPCVAAYSSVRALFSGYNGSLYQVTRASDNSSLNVGLLTAGGYANAASQDSFCSATTCIITKVYDQTSQHNDLTIEGAGTAASADVGATANILPVTIAGHNVYGIYLPRGTGYRRVTTSGIATGSAPESMYEVASGTNVNNGCCSDFGNVETNNNDTGASHMDAVTLGLLNDPGSTGHGPWVEADLENGVFEGGTAVNTANAGNPSKFVTALLKNNGTTTFALKGGNSQSGTLSTWYSGALPSGYSPMNKEGSIVLGTGGDNSNWGTSSFFEGVMTTGYSTDAADNSVQANIVAAGYAGNTSGGGPGSTIVGPGGKCVNVDGSDTGGNGAAITLWDCNALDADQHWSPSALGNGTLSTLGRCLDVIGNSTTPGAKLQLYDCNGFGGQQWIPQENGSILNPQSGLCLDDPSGNTTNGTQLQIWTCNNLSPQQFSVTAGTPVALSSGSKCMDVAGADVGGNGAVVDVWDCHNAATFYPLDRDQQWTVNSDQTIRTLGRCLDIVNNGNTPGAKMQLWDCNGVPGQKWVPQSNGSLLNPNSGLCLDDPSGNITNGTQLQVWTCNGFSPQVYNIN